MSVLRRGDRGALVWELQRRLRQVGVVLDSLERRESLFGVSTERAVRELQLAAGLADDGVVDQPTEDAIAKRVAEYRPPERYRVFGVVRRADGEAASDVLVEALDVDVFALQPLGTAKTDATGHYEIVFVHQRFSKTEQFGPDLLVRIVEQRHDLLPHAKWPNADLGGRVYSNAGPETRIDLVVGGGEYLGPSEWERLQRVVRPLLADRPARTIATRQYELLIEDSDLSSAIIDAFVHADALAERARVLGAPVDDEVFYALLRPTSLRELDAIVAAPEARLRAVLLSAQPVAIAPKQATWVDASMRALAVLRRALLAAAPVAAIGRIAQLDQETTARVLSAFGRGVPAANAWNELRADTTLAAKVPAIQRVLHFQTLARGHLPLVEKLEERYGSAQATSLGHFLASLTQADWDTLVQATGSPQGVDRTAYSALLMRTVERAFPTHVVAQRLQSTANHPELASYLAASADESDLDQAPVSSWKNDGIAQDTVDEAARLQRLHKTTGDVAQTLLLFDGGLNSASEMVRQGPAALVRAGVPEAIADATLKRANARRDHAVWLWRHHSIDLDPHAHPNVPGVSYCECEECASLLSPAAYLVELLSFTEKGDKLIEHLYWQGGNSSRVRRADLGQLELSCANTNRLLPQIDLANELLENAIASPSAVVPYQTTLEDDALLLAPEHRNASVYDDTLASAKHPWSPSLNVLAIEYEAWLTALGTSRRELAELLNDGSADWVVVGLDAADRIVVAVADADAATLATPENFGLSGALALPDPINSAGALLTDWRKVLARGKYFLAQTGLSQDEFFAVRSTAALSNLGGNLPDGACGLETATLSNLTDTTLARVVRFVRMLRRTGLSILELDAFCQKNATDAVFGDAAIQELAALLRLRDRTCRSFTEVLSWTGLPDSTPSTSPELPSLCRAFGLSSGDLVDLAALKQSATSRSAIALEALLDALNLLRQSALSIAEARFLLVDTSSNIDGLAIDANSQEVLLATIQAARSAGGNANAVVAAAVAGAFALPLKGTTDVLSVSGAPFAATATAAQLKLDYQLVAKIALVVKRLQLSSGALTAWSTQPTTWLAFSDLATPSSTPPFEKLLEMLRLAALRSWALPGRTSLVELAAKASSDAADLASAIGVDAIPVDAIGGLDLHNATSLALLRRRLDVAEKTGVTCTLLLAWAGSTLSSASVSQITDAVRARTGIDAWPGTARPIANRLREQRRDALVGYLCSRDHKTPDQLSARGLLDVEMSSCQLTTRIRQALNSAQLFLQGVTLGLELENPDELDPTKMVALTLGTPEERAAEWQTWLSSYTSWRLARDTFLFPENYLDASVRSSTTPLYLDFDKRLSQSDVTASAVEEAYGNYVRALDQIALLEPLSLVDDKPADGDGDWVTHIFARTRGATPSYYYRTQVNLHRFTPWQKLELDIQSEHVFPAMHDGTLYLFWATFDDKQDSAITSNPNGKSIPPDQSHHFEVTLAWSELKAGVWSPKRLAKDKLVLASEDPPLAGKELAWTFEVGVVGHVQGFLAKDDQPSDAYNSDLIVVCRHVVGAANEFGWWIISPCSGASKANDVGKATSAFGGPDLDGTKGVQIEVQPLQTAEGPQGRGLLFLDNMPQPIGIAHSLSIPAPAFLGQPPPYVIDDSRRSYYVMEGRTWTDAEKLLAIPDAADPGFALSDSIADTPAPTLGFTAARLFYHPFSCSFVRAQGASGSAGVFDAAVTALPQDDFSTYFTLHDPQIVLSEPFPSVELELGPSGAYSDYNWELLFYAPLRAAELLAQSGRFDDALTWMHRIYDPRIAGAALSPKLAWRFAVFANRDETLLAELLALTDYSGDDPNVIAARQIMEATIEEWRANPFDPYDIGRHRVSAFMRFVRQKYVELLIAYGDSFFTDNTIEGLNRATQLYQWALAVLGERPAVHPKRTEAVAKTYDQLKDHLDAFGNALVEIVDMENYVPVSNASSAVTLPLHQAAYFCVPLNAKYLALWDKVEDRLWKARHCQNLQGAERILALFGGTLDAAIFAEANRLGIEFSDVIALGSATSPIYRFAVLTQKAIELANELRSFASALLSAAEKRDAEMLALLRQKHERDILAAVRAVKQQMLDEAMANRETLRANRLLAQERSDYYGSRDYQNEAELQQLDAAHRSAKIMDVAAAHDVMAAVLAWIPLIQTGIQGVGASPTATVSVGGTNFSQALSATATGFRSMGGRYATEASLAGTKGAFDRRKDDWDFQKRLADKEIAQIDRQLDAAELRISIATKELANHDLQSAQSAEIAKALREKLTPLELYDRNWQTLGALHDRLADIARAAAYRAQDSYRYERADEGATFIESDRQVGFGARLVVGDRLLVALRRMEAAYLDSNQRKQELTRHVSLALDFPEAFLKLRETGSCDVALDESFFEADLPGQYQRRLRNVALTVACPIGPYQPLHAKLSLADATYRLKSGSGTDAALFSKPAGTIGPVTISRGVEDSGMFEVNLRDERLLWFEGAGVLGTYKIEVASGTVDLSQLSDVVLHLRYDALDGGAALPTVSTSSGARFFAARSDFSDAWELFTDGAPAKRTIQLRLDASRFPFAARGGGITKLVVYWKGTNGSGVAVTAKSAAGTSAATLETSSIGALFEAALALSSNFGVVELEFESSALPEDLGVIVSYGPKV